MLWYDLRLAANLLRKSPGFTAATIVTLAIGIGANATIFSLADAVYLRLLPIDDADRIVHVYQRRPRSTTDPYPLSYSDYLDYRSRARSFELLAAHYSTSPMHLVIDAEPHAVNGAVVTASYFELLQLQPVIGRFFRADEDTVRDRDAVAVISYALWQQQYGGSSDIIGRTIRVNDHPFTILGVAPAHFTGVHNGDLKISVWIPTAMFRYGYRFCDAVSDRSCTIIEMLGKLKRGTSRLEAQRELDVIARQLATAYPSTNSDLGVTLAAARGRGYGGWNPLDATQLQLFGVAVALVLLIGCANVAGLLLARAIRRRREIAVRLALGATRRRLIRQLFSESLLIAIAGGVLGLLLAVWAKDLLGAFNATDYAGRPRDFRLDLSGPVMAATLAITLCATILFGLVPALQGSKPDVLPILKDESATGSPARARLRQLLVIGQIALAIMLVVAAGLLVQSVRRIVAGPGFDLRPVITLRLRPGLLNYPTERALAVQRDIIRRLEAMPGIVSASPAGGAIATPAPLVGDSLLLARDERGDRQFTVREARVGPRYFATLGVPMVEGREFDDRDDATAPRVIVVNDFLAKQLAAREPVPPKLAVIGARKGGVISGTTVLLGGQPHEIVGVVKDAQYYADGQPRHAVVYRSYWQPDANGGFNKDSRTIVRVAGDPWAMMPRIRREVAAVDPAVPISEDYPLSDRVRFEFQSVSMTRTLLVTFGVVALFLSAVGLYGVLAFTVGQRTREIGVRVALGARRRDVSRLVLREGLIMTAIGSGLGLVGAWVSVRFLASFLYGVQSSDAATFMLAPIVLIVIALLASYLPARRAARVSPMTALRFQ